MTRIAFVGASRYGRGVQRACLVPVPVGGTAELANVSVAADILGADHPPVSGTVSVGEVVSVRLACDGGSWAAFAAWQARSPLTALSHGTLSSA